MAMSSVAFLMIPLLHLIGCMDVSARSEMQSIRVFVSALSARAVRLRPSRHLDLARQTDRSVGRSAGGHTHACSFPSLWPAGWLAECAMVFFLLARSRPSLPAPLLLPSISFPPCISYAFGASSRRSDIRLAPDRHRRVVTRAPKGVLGWHNGLGTPKSRGVRLRRPTDGPRAGTSPISRARRAVCRLFPKRAST